MSDLLSSELTHGICKMFIDEIGKRQLSKCQPNVIVTASINGKLKN